jgi:VWFA-related protein
MRRAVAVATACLAFGSQLSVRGEPAAREQLVRIDVIPTDARGRIVEDLKPADFELRDEGTPQVLESVRFVRVTAPPPSTPPPAPIVIHTTADEHAVAARDEARLMAIYLDEYHVSAGASTDRARDALRHFIDTDVSPRDLVFVLKPLDSLLEIRAAADLDAVRATIDGFQGRKGDYEPRNQYERDFFAGTPARIEAARNQVAISAINALAVHLGSLTDRRKTLVVVSEGIGGSERHRGLDSLATLETIRRSADRANVALYAVDPRESDTDDTDGLSLRRIAGETDGQAIAGDLDSGLRRAAADATAYYLLTYRSLRPDDGTFHAVQVSVKRKGTTVRARNGYFAASPDEAIRIAVLASINAPKPVLALEPAPHVSPLVHAWFGESRGVAGKTRVTFVWEPAGHVFGDRTRQLSPARLVLTAKAPDGSLLFEGVVAPTGPAAIDEPGGTPARVVFEAPPGRLRLRMSIEDVTQKELDLDVRDISVRDLKGAVAVSSPEVLRARNAREFRTLDAEDAVPVSSREFSRSEHLLIRFQTYGPADAPPSVSARLLGRQGSFMRKLTLAPSAVAGESEIDLSLAGFAAAEYTVEVTATSGSDKATDRVSFRVTP